MDKFFSISLVDWGSKDPISKKIYIPKKFQKNIVCYHVDYRTAKKESDKKKKLKIKINNKIVHQSKLINYFLNKMSLPKVEKETNDLLKKKKKNKKYVFSKKDIMMVESLKSDGVQVMKKYDKLYENKFNVPVEINSMIVNGETGLILLKIAHLIGEDELENIDLESINFIVGIMNELNTINLRNEILLTVLPLKV